MGWYCGVEREHRSVLLCLGVRTCPVRIPEHSPGTVVWGEAALVSAVTPPAQGMSCVDSGTFPQYCGVGRELPAWGTSPADYGMFHWCCGVRKEHHSEFLGWTA